ncbi:phospholipid phosphatase 2 [Elysia marginata]|uniref:Phospholipid phosphatase 2 n=1 Tax=Elysia marginata TaxID=1093978 RepID=A0AAV4HS73_9GAST|nr:phospholipid phosphatase 2 [Elysia marginata]
MTEPDPPTETGLEEILEPSQEKQAGEEPPAGDSWYKDTRIWINLVGYIAVTVALIILKVRPDFMPSTERAFDCTDSSIKYPKKPDSVRQQTLIISTVSILLISVFISEGVYSITPEYHSQRSAEALGDTGGALKDKIYLFINLVTSKLLYGYLGLIMTMNLTYHLQYMSSSFRPDFLEVCETQPHYCTSNTIGYFANCQQKNKELLLDSRMSFPSEYASISFYMVIFSAMIIERAISGEFFALKLAVQSSYVFWAIYVTCSRIKDNKNHPIDCVAGSGLGTFMALLTDYMATYSDYMDGGGYYDPNNITLNIHDWEEGGEAPPDDHNLENQGPQDYGFR